MNGCRSHPGGTNERGLKRKDLRISTSTHKAIVLANRRVTPEVIVVPQILLDCSDRTNPNRATQTCVPPGLLDIVNNENCQVRQTGPAVNIFNLEEIFNTRGKTN